MSNNNNKQPLDLTEFLLVDTGETGYEKHTEPSNGLGIPKIKKRVAPGIPSHPVEASISDVKPGKKNDSLVIAGINQPDVTTGNLSHSDEASTSTPIIDRITDVNQTPYYEDKSDDMSHMTIGFLLGCAKRGQNRDNQRPPSICKVPRILRDHSESSFTPQLVSIGPIHREDPKLQEFEWLKECYLNDLLSRCDSMPKETILEECLLKVNTLIPQIRESYAGMFKKYSDVELARMMVMDGCFILEFCFKHEEEDEYLPNKMQNLRIAMDLILLENQVPFVVLQRLFDCLAPYIGSVTLNQVLDKYLAPYIKLFRRSPEKNSILKLFCSLLPEKKSTTDVVEKKISTTDVSDSTPAHVLGYMHKRYQLLAAKSSKPKHEEASKTVNKEQAAKSSKPKDAEEIKLVDEKGMEDTYTTFHSIVELDRSGMNFKPHQKDVWSMTIKFQSSLLAYLPFFWGKPTLLMPILVTDDTTELILRNFIAYEQSFPQDHYYFTSYAHAMDKLIDSQEDIAKLVESKVLVNNLGSNQKAADMINKICKNMFVTDFYYTDEFKRMDTYYNGYWPNTIAWLRRVYFSNPWNFIALVAAIILFGLTVVQTIYTIRAA